MPTTYISKLTLEVLESHGSHIAQVWRAIRLLGSTGGVSAPVIAERMGVPQVQASSLKRLMRGGWVKRVGGRGTINDSYTYTASTDGETIGKVSPKKHIHTAGRRLTKLSKKAHAARYTAISGKMSNALREIEAEALEIREILYSTRGGK